MSTYLSMANKLLSLRGAIRITDENDNLAYEAKGEFALFSPTWTVWQGDTRRATLRRRIFAWRPTWDVQGDLGSFAIKRKIFSFRRKMYVVGGPYADASVLGNIWDLQFSIRRGDTPLAVATGKILTLRDRHNLELLSDKPDDALFTVIAMVAVQLERKANEKNDRFKRDND